MHKTLGTLLIAFAVVGAAQAAMAGPVEDALDAQMRGDYATALKLFKPVAEAGDQYAQFSLGFMYNVGQGVQQNYTEAVRWYRRSAEQGYASAQTNLGNMYATGHGVRKDLVHAHMWYSLAAAFFADVNGNSASTQRDAIEADMTQAQIIQAQAMAERCQRSNFKNCDD
jgi:TPR repeat protein